MIDVQEELKRLSPTEREQAVKILQEYAKEGKSETMDKFLYEDYAEIPVDIHTFLHEEQYLGAALYDKEGRFTLYPYWEDMLAKVFPTNIDTNYHTAILTGGIGIGKSTVAVIGMIYALYRMLCLKDPQIHYGLQNNELISFVFVNMTLREAKGVAWAKFHNFVLQSEWFMQRGEISRSTILPTWKPYNKSIELYAASTPGMLQGRAVFSCLDGDTLILTTNGEMPIKDLVCQDINVISIDENGNQVVSDECTVLPTIETNEEYDIELEDGTILKCTPTHRFMLKDGTYKETQYLTEDDEFFGLNKNIKIKSIVKRILDEPKIFYDVINANPYNNFVVKCDDSYVVSHNCFVDEVNFSTTTIDIVKQKARAKKLVTEASNRLQSRFMKGVKNPTTLWLASSKASDQSYLDEFINEKKQIESKTTIIVDEPQWIVRNDKDSAVKFPVAIGNKFMENALLPKNADDNIIKQYTDRGYTILMVPIGYWENFNQDLDGSLRDIAGISVGASSNFISGSRLVQCVNEDFKNPFTKEIIKVGNDPNDLQQYYNFFDMSCVPKSLMAKPLFIHIDPSLSGDKTGLAGTWIIGKKGNDLHFQLAFSVSIEAPKGRQVSFEKTRNFIRWLKNMNFRIVGISADTFQSASTLQELEAEGYNTKVISVDRVKDRQCIPYEFLRNVLYEQRVIMYKTQLLRDELVGLQKDNTTGKVDHTKLGINCLKGDTQIQLVDGRSLSIKDLVEEHQRGVENFVYSINEETLKIEPKRIINAWMSGKDAPLVEVTLDNGEKIRCTPEHRFMLRDGQYCEAQNLVANDSLMPLYTKLSGKGLKGYRLYYEPSEDLWHYEHRKFATEVLDEKYLVHHKNKNKTDNSPTNLIWMSKKSHVDIHSKEKSGAYTEEASQKRANSVKKYHEDGKESPEYWTRYYRDMSPSQAYEHHLQVVSDAKERREKREEKIKRGKDNRAKIQQKRDEMCKYFGVVYENLSDHEKRSLSIKYAHISDKTYQERVSASVSQRHKDGKHKKSREALAKCNEESHKRKIERYHQSEKYQEILKMNDIFGIDYESLPHDKKISYIHRYHNMVKKGIVNHKVVSVEFIQEKADVYDIEVEDNHNFALSAGVFVHNSKDQADAFCGSLYNASLHAEEYAFEYGESIETMLNVSSKHDEKLDSLTQLPLPNINPQANNMYGLGTQGSVFNNKDILLGQGIFLI